MGNKPSSISGYPNYRHFKHTIEPKPSDELRDENREFKDLSTDIVVKCMVSTSDTMYAFLSLVYNTFYDKIAKYKTKKGLDETDILFLYKGGNILRIIGFDFLSEMPRQSRKLIETFYADFFKRSDADFSIYVNPKLREYDTIYQDMVWLAYILQVEIRNQFSATPTTYFNFVRYSKLYADRLLRPFYQKGVEANSFIDENNSKYYGHKLLSINFLGNGYPYQTTNYQGVNDTARQITSDGRIAVFNLDDIQHGMYIQMNETLDFQSPNGRIKFALVRTKMAFNYLFQKPDGVKYTKVIGGELIDVSVPHRLDSNFGHFYEHNPLENIHKYVLTSGKSSLEFYSYNYQYLANDLEFILFRFVAKPWNTPKYEKRLNRLFYLYVIDLFIKLPTLAERKNILLDLQKKVFGRKLTDVYEGGRDILDTIQYYEDKYRGSDLLINYLLGEIRRILLNEIATEEDLQNYNKMVGVLGENVSVMNRALRGIRDFCETQGRIRPENLYQNEFRNLIE